jgi:hypothetical protein
LRGSSFDLVLGDGWKPSTSKRLSIIAATQRPCLWHRPPVFLFLCFFRESLCSPRGHRGETPLLGTSIPHHCNSSLTPNNAVPSLPRQIEQPGAHWTSNDPEVGGNCFSHTETATCSGGRGVSKDALCILRNVPRDILRRPGADLQALTWGAIAHNGARNAVSLHPVFALRLRTRRFCRLNSLRRSGGEVPSRPRLQILLIVQLA